MKEHTNFETGVLPFIIATLGEGAALFGWVQLFGDGRYLLATLVLWAGFLAERLAVLFWVNKNFGTTVGVASTAKPAWQRLLGVLAITLSEILIWVAFFLIAARFGYVAGFVVLFVLEQLEHSMELGLLKGQPMASFFLDRTALTITALEAAGGVAMLYLVQNGRLWEGGLVLLAALAVEHVVQGGKIKPEAVPAAATAAGGAA